MALDLLAHGPGGEVLHHVPIEGELHAPLMDAVREPHIAPQKDRGVLLKAVAD